MCVGVGPGSAASGRTADVDVAVATRSWQRAARRFLFHGQRLAFCKDVDKLLCWLVSFIYCRCCCLAGGGYAHVSGSESADTTALLVSPPVSQSQVQTLFILDLPGKNLLAYFEIFVQGLVHCLRFAYVMLGSDESCCRLGVRLHGADDRVTPDLWHRFGDVRGEWLEASLVLNIERPFQVRIQPPTFSHLLQSCSSRCFDFRLLWREWCGRARARSPSTKSCWNRATAVEQVRVCGVCLLSYHQPVRCLLVRP